MLKTICYNNNVIWKGLGLVTPIEIPDHLLIKETKYLIKSLTNNDKSTLKMQLHNNKKH